MSALPGKEIGPAGLSPPQGIEIGEKLLWKYENPFIHLLLSTKNLRDYAFVCLFKGIFCS